jgi:Ca2+-binding RTX toxin-like protein
MTPRRRTALVGLVPLLAGMLVFGGSPASAGVTHQCRGLAATIVGTKGNDTLRGTSHADVIVGLQGSDVIRGRGGNDIVCGGQDTGEDFYDYDHLFGNKGNDILLGQGGYDFLHGGPGADKLMGGQESDRLQGGRGNDIIKGGKNFPWESGDFISYSRGPVNVDLARGVSVAPGVGTDHLSGIEDVGGSPADDVILGNGSKNGLGGGLGNDTISGRGGNDELSGGDGINIVRGGRGQDGILGGSSHDRLYGGKGNDDVGDSETLHVNTTPGDLIVGGHGDDILNSSAGDDHLVGGNGDDAALFVAAPSGVTVSLAAGTASGDGTDVLSSVENVFGSGYDDVLQGTSGPNTIEGFYGSDTIRGRGGDDLLGGSPSPDSAASGILKIYGGRGSDVIGNTSCIGCGLKYQDRTLLFGGRGNDEIRGGPSGAHIDGGAGSDLVHYIFAGDVVSVTVDLAQGTGTFRSDCGSPSCAIDSFVSIERAAGSIGDDLLIGDGGDNVLRGYGGHDELRGAAGDDRVYGGGGPDRLRGGVGFDHLFGGRGTDACTGGEVTDSC